MSLCWAWAWGWGSNLARPPARGRAVAAEPEGFLFMPRKLKMSPHILIFHHCLAFISVYFPYQNDQVHICCNCAMPCMQKQMLDSASLHLQFTRTARGHWSGVHSDGWRRLVGLRGTQFLDKILNASSVQNVIIIPNVLVFNTTNHTLHANRWVLHLRVKIVPYQHGESGWILR